MYQIYYNNVLGRGEANLTRTKSGGIHAEIFRSHRSHDLHVETIRLTVV